MDAFEKARQKHAKNLANRMKYEEKQEPQAEPPAEPPAAVPQAPKTNDAVIDVKVSLPAGSFDIRLVKPSIAQNVRRLPSRLDIENCVRNGLRPLLGELKG